MDDVEPLLEACGFIDRKVILKEESKNFIKNWLPGSGAEDYVVSANITARKPVSPFCTFIEDPVHKTDTKEASSTDAKQTMEEKQTDSTSVASSESCCASETEAQKTEQTQGERAQVTSLYV